MSKSITVRDVPDETRDELASRAASSGRSMQEYLREQLIDLAQRPSASTLATRIKTRKATVGGSLNASQILAHLDADRA